VLSFLKPGTLCTTKSKGRSTFGRQSRPIWRQCRPRQAVEFDFVASVTGDKVETSWILMKTV